MGNIQKLYNISIYIWNSETSSTRIKKIVQTWEHCTKSEAYKICTVRQVWNHCLILKMNIYKTVQNTKYI